MKRGAIVTKCHQLQIQNAQEQQFQRHLLKSSKLKERVCPSHLSYKFLL